MSWPWRLQVSDSELLQHAVTVDTTVTIDWAELGRAFAGELSPHQAEFLTAFYENVNDVQLAYIGSEGIFGDGDARHEIGQLFKDLGSFIQANHQ